VIESGSVVESGKHTELLRKGGRYASFYRLQLQGQEDKREVAPTAPRKIVKRGKTNRNG
jgi:ATP-binding cassette subfamily B protein